MSKVVKIWADLALIGIVRAPLLTTLMQVTSRFFLTWVIAYNFPQTTKDSPAYSAMLLAWSVTEVIRYSYFVFVLGGKGVPKLWTWLRYALNPSLPFPTLHSRINRRNFCSADILLDTTPSSYSTP